MKLKSNISACVILILALFGNVFSFDSPRSSVIRTEEGFIDYANRIIVSRGSANILQRSDNQGEFQIIEKNLKFSKSEARSHARGNLLGLIKLVNFDSWKDIK